MLLFLDYEKGLDSVESFKNSSNIQYRQYLYEMCKKGLYTSPMFKMKNDGYLSKSCKTCKMTSDIRQGCPISALLISL